MPLRSAGYFKSATMRWSRKSKRSDLLSVNMISLPLGDFKHLSHIGLDARSDAFGDLSAFQRGGSLILHSSQSHQDLFLTRTPNITPPPKPPRLLSPEEMEAQAIKKPRMLPLTARHKKCHSLPLLDSLEVVEQEKIPPREEEVQKEVREKKAGLTMRTEVSELGEAPNPTIEPVGQTEVEEEPCFVLNLDLGPSLLEEVLQVMDRLQQ
ncbi:cdc42 effector protein 3-like [Polymixia lowei]